MENVGISSTCETHTHKHIIVFLFQNTFYSQNEWEETKERKKLKINNS
jgi:hypothetical protein